MSRAIHYCHWVVLFFVITGWLSPWREALWLHVFFVPMMIAHWKTNEDRCVLTEMEARFRSYDYKEEVQEGQFLKEIMHKLFGRVPSEETMTKITYGVLAIAWTLSVLRLTWKFR